MQDLIAIAGALADESRMRALAACFAGELCVCQITELLGLATSTVSKHLSILKQAGLVQTRKEGRWIYYRLPDNPDEPVRSAIAWLRGRLARDPQTAQDCRQLRRILCIDPEVLCLRQRTGSACCSSAPATPAGARWRKAGRGTSKAK